MPRSAALAPLLIAIAACGPAASPLRPDAPTFDPKGQTKCAVTKSQARPLIVEWPSPDRVALETQARKGLVAVRYQGCEMEVLRRCRAPGRYAYSAATRQDDRVTIRDEDELYASIPVYAAKFEGKLRKAGQLEVAMTVVGTFDADRGRVRADELEGECDGATHVIASLTVGAFEFFAGGAVDAKAGATVLGAGAEGRTGSQRETLNRAGDGASCTPSRGDKEPPPGCGALLRVEVAPLAAAAPGATSTRASTPAPPSTATPAAPPPIAAAPAAPIAPPAAPPPAAAASPGTADAAPVTTTASAAAPAKATPASKEQARSLYKKATERFEVADYEGALALFREADAALHSPAVHLDIGRCLEKLGRRDEAAASYRKLLAEAPTGAKAVEAQRRLDALTGNRL